MASDHVLIWTIFTGVYRDSGVIIEMIVFLSKYLTSDDSELYAIFLFVTVSV